MAARNRYFVMLTPGEWETIVRALGLNPEHPHDFRANEILRLALLANKTKPAQPKPTREIPPIEARARAWSHIDPYVLER